MSDNIDVTPGTGKTVATDDVGGIQYQVVKLDLGANGSSAPAIGAIPVTPSPTDIAPATQNITVVDSGSTSTSSANQQVLVTGSPTAGSVASFSLSSEETVRVEVTGTWTGIVTSEISIDGGTTWFAQGLHQGAYTTSTFPGNFVGGGSVTGATNYRLRATSTMTGTAVVKIIQSINTNSVYIANAAPAGTIVSALNSTVAILTSGSVFTGAGEDVSNFSEMRVSVFSNVASATDGLSLQQSSDNTNWDVVDTYTIPALTAGQGKTFVVPRQARYFRVVYTNGGTNQTTFRLQAILNRTATAPSSQRASDGYTNETDLVQNQAFLMGYNGTTWDRIRTVGTGVLSASVVLTAGSVIIGKVGIDQTTPGTTNAVSANQGTAATLALGWPVLNGEASDTTGTFTNATQSTSVTASSLDGYGNVLISINGTYGTATAVFEGSDDGGTTWYGISEADRTDSNLIESGYTSLTNTTRAWQISNPGWDSIRVRSTAVTSGTVNVRISPSAAPTSAGASVSIGVALPTGANTIGALTANQSVNVSQINAVTPLMGNGVTGTGSQRVTIASDNTAFSVNSTLSAETTKVIGTVNQGTSPWVTSNATTSVVGNGAGTTAQRVTLANDSTGIIATVGAVTAITNALPAGTNSIGKISDITTSVVPGTAATNLGKAEDAGHTSGDTGVMALGVRNDSVTAFSGTDLDYTPIAVDSTGTQYVVQKASTATLSNVASSATSVTILAANTARKGAQIYNDSTQICYVKFGTTASSTSFTVPLAAATYYELPAGYTGRIDGIWVSANGNARVTEVT